MVYCFLFMFALFLQQSKAYQNAERRSGEKLLSRSACFCACALVPGVWWRERAVYVGEEIDFREKEKSSSGEKKREAEFLYLYNGGTRFAI